MERISAETSITGARTKRRMPIISVICILLTSLVKRVTKDAVENFSMLEKANSWMWSYSAVRRLAPKPWPATAENAALPRPKDKETMAIRTMSTPFFKM